MQLTEAQQIAMLEPLCDAADEGRASTQGELFFRAIKNMTADGYYTSKAGLSRSLDSLEAPYWRSSQVARYLNIEDIHCACVDRGVGCFAGGRPADIPFEKLTLDLGRQ